MKPRSKLFIVGLGMLALVVTVLMPYQSVGQAPVEDPATMQLINEIAAQQTQIIANQAAIEEKMVAITENLRIAKIFVSRGGGKR